MPPTFSHLHVHTDYSLLDGFSHINKLFSRSIEHGAPALAITDHGNMFGVFSFVAEAHKHKNADGSLKVKPIVGCEFYIVEDRHKTKFTAGTKDKRYHQILLAKNKEGYNNLSTLCSLGFLEGLYGKYPRIDKTIIEQHSAGLIATSCCIGAIIPQLILQGKIDEAEAELKWWLNIFGDDFYIELQRHKLEEQNKVNHVLCEFARKYHIKTIATNDVHYVDQPDAGLHDILLCVNTGEKLNTPPMREIASDEDASLKKNTRFAFPNEEFFLKTPDEMHALFSDIPEAIANTQEIVDKIETLHLERDIMLPHYPLPANYDSQDAYLTHLTWEGARKKYSEITDEVRERLTFELEVIQKMGFAGYFLIVYDFINAAREMDIAVGPGRGSAAGSVVAYCIGITNIDPIKYNLLFERFLNPDRKSMPDIDTDFDDEGRDKVISYVSNKYGADKVAQIVTYGTMGAKSSIKDVARVKDVPLGEADQLAKLVPDGVGIRLKKIFSQNERELDNEFSTEEMQGISTLKKRYGDPQDAQYQLLHEAERLEGTVRNVGIHAAGILIAPEPLMSMMPVCKVKDSVMVVSQIDGADIERAGVLKMDFLGLTTLSIIKRAVEIVAKTKNIKIDIDGIPLDDKATYELYQRGDTLGTFQFESPGMRKYLQELRPDKFEDLIAMNALYRPGPMDYIPSFIRRKQGREDVQYDLPEMEEYLGETYGVTVYQEQVMRLSQKLADFSRGEADILRKAMGKKQKSVLDDMKARFLERGAKKGHPTQTLEKIWTDWEAFAMYAFNKSHSTCYSLLAYQTAYLKTHYRTAYVAALIDYTKDPDKITAIIADATANNIQVLPPDLNESEVGCFVNKEGQIRFGFKRIKSLGIGIAEQIIEERNKNGAFKDVFDLVERLPMYAMNKRSMEALVYSGCFDNFKGIKRMEYVHLNETYKDNYVQQILKYAQQFHTAKQDMAQSLFGAVENTMQIARPRPREGYVEVPLITQLAKEREFISFYLSAHPLDSFRFAQQHYPVQTIQEAQQAAEKSGGEQSARHTFNLMGIITKADHRQSKNGSLYARFVVEDYNAAMEISVFKDDYKRFAPLLKENTAVYIQGVYETNPYSQESFFAPQRIYDLSQLDKHTKSISLYAELSQVSDEMVDFFVRNKHRNTGNIPLHFYIRDGEKQLLLQHKSLLRFDGNKDFQEFITTHSNTIRCVLQC